jgi:HlyD family secretion protein
MPEDVLTAPRSMPGTPPAGRPRPAVHWRLPAIGLLVAAGAAGAWWYLDRHAKPDRAGSSAASGASAANRTAPRVEVVRPERGGLGRTVVQPGQVQAFNRAQLYAKVSGYLVRQKVDIGDAVKKGQVLAEVDAPELFKARDQARAAVDQARGKIKQMESRVLTARADRESAVAAVEVAKAAITRFTADRVYRKEELTRIAYLVQQKSVEQRLLDEQQKQLDAAVSAEAEAKAGVAAASAQLSAADARIAQAEADLEAARADLEANKAAEAHSQVLVDYTRIISPYDGVVTLRSFHDGDFIRSAADGGAIPVLAVAQTDLMRVVIFVPDLDVPFVDRGDPATVRVDALQGRVFRGVVARFANVENDQKLMRTEVDLPNPDNRLRDGMYGTTIIEVQPPSRNLRIPSSCLIEQGGQGQGAVYIVRDGKVHRQAVEVGQDNGGEVEIISGLTPDDQVVVRYNGTIDEGLAVRTDAVKAAPGGGKQP